MIEKPKFITHERIMKGEEYVSYSDYLLLQRERDEARELNAKLIALAERATDDLRWFYESHADGISLELEKLKEGAK